MLCGGWAEGGVEAGRALGICFKSLRAVITGGAVGIRRCHSSTINRCFLPGGGDGEEEKVTSRLPVSIMILS